MNAMTETRPLTEDAPTLGGMVSTTALVLQGDSMDRMVKTAELMAQSRVTVPKHLQGSVGDCMAVIMQAMQWGMNPFAVAQKTHLVNGTLGYEAQLVNAVVQSTGAINGSFKYEYRGEGEAMECRAGAILRGETSITWGEWLCVKSVAVKNSPLWKTNPKQQLGYLQVKNWARAYAPGAILGVYTTDELEPMPAERDVTPGAAAEQAPKTLPAYTDAQFEQNKDAWDKAIKGGKKTADAIIATISTKYTLSDELVRKIRNLGAIEGQAEIMANAEDIAGLRQRAEAATISEAAILKHLGIDSFDNLTMKQLDQADAYVQNPV